MSNPDADLLVKDKGQLLAAAQAMRQAIRMHRDTSRHELRWHHPDMWSLLPDESAVPPVLPEWPQFMRGCIRYRQSLDQQLAEAPRSDREFEQ